MAAEIPVELIKFICENLKSFALRNLCHKNKHDAEDLTQQTFVNVEKNWSSIQNRSLEEQKAYCHRALVNLFIYYGRRKKSIELNFATDISICDHDDSSEIDKDGILQELATMNDSCAETTKLYLLGYSFAEIAAIKKLSINTVLGQHRYTKNKLRKKFNIENVFIDSETKNNNLKKRKRLQARRYRIEASYSKKIAS